MGAMMLQLEILHIWEATGYKCVPLHQVNDHSTVPPCIDHCRNENRVVLPHLECILQDPAQVPLFYTSLTRSGQFQDHPCLFVPLICIAGHSYEARSHDVAGDPEKRERPKEAKNLPGLFQGHSSS